MSPPVKSTQSNISTYNLPESAEPSPAPASVRDSEAFDGRQVSHLKSDDLTIEKLHVALEKSSIAKTILSIPKALYYYVRAWLSSPMRDESWIIQGNQHWQEKNPNQIAYPTGLNDAIQFLKNNKEPLSLPYCIPVHVGSNWLKNVNEGLGNWYAQKYGHWVTLVLHTNSDGQTQATLFNSKAGCSTNIQNSLKEPLQQHGIESFKTIEVDLQDRLRLSCSAFSVAAIDTVMRNQTNVDGALTEFATEFLQKSAAEEDAWDAEWGAKMNPQNVLEGDSSSGPSAQPSGPSVNAELDDMPQLLPR